MGVFDNKQLYTGGGAFEDIPGTENQRVNRKPKAWDQRKAESLRHAFEMANLTEQRGLFTPDPDPEYDWARKAEQMAMQANRLRMQAAQQRAKNAAIRVGNSQVNLPNLYLGGMNIPKGKFGNFIRAIAGQESGGNYGVVNQDSGALGKYQIMPSNLAGSGRGWDYEALGRDISTRAFLSNPRLQEQIARAKLREYFNKYGAAGAASAWYSGDPYKGSSRASQGRYPSVYNYVQAILRRMGR